MPSIDKLRHNIRHAVSLSAFSPNLIHRIRYFFLCTVTFRDHSVSSHGSYPYSRFYIPRQANASGTSAFGSTPAYSTVFHKYSFAILFFFSSTSLPVSMHRLSVRLQDGSGRYPPGDAAAVSPLLNPCSTLLYAPEPEIVTIQFRTAVIL